MSDSVYMVVTVLGEGGQGSRGGSIAIFARTPPKQRSSSRTWSFALRRATGASLRCGRGRLGHNTYNA
jgi:hypothetical protein